MSASGSSRRGSRSAAWARWLAVALAIAGAQAAGAQAAGMQAAGTQAASRVPVDLVVDGRAAGSIEAEIQGDDVRLERARLREAFALVLAEGPLAMLAGDQPMGLAELRGMGIDAVFDHAALSVSLSVPVALRRETMLDVMAGPGEAGLPVEGPATVSGYLNVTASVDLLSGSLAASSSGWEVPIDLVLEPVLNLAGWVLEGRTTFGFSPGAGSGVQASLDFARLVKDFPAESVRVAAGSLFLPVTGFQSAFPLYGVEVIWDPAIFSATRTDPLPGGELAFDLPGSVTVSLNGRPVRTFTLAPGRYRIGGLPLETGLNRVHYDDPQPVDILVPYDPRLLASGETTFAAGAGIQSVLPPLAPIASAWARHGFGSFVTAGLEMQTGLDRGMAGGSVLVATPIGTWLAAAGMSLDWRGATGTVLDGAALLQYRLGFPGDPLLPGVVLETRYAGRTFAPPAPWVGEGAVAPEGAVPGASPYSWQLSASVNQALPLGFGLGIGLGYRVGWQPEPDALALTAVLSHEAGKGAAISLLVSAQGVPGAPPTLSVSLGLTSAAPDGRSSGAITTGLAGGSTSVDLHLQPGSAATVISASLAGLGGSGGAGGAGGSLGVQYAGPLVEASISDSLTGMAITPGALGGVLAASGNRLTVTAGMALVGAGGSFAFSRPIDDSFAIVVPSESLAGQRVVATSSGGGDPAVAQAGRGVLSRGLFSRGLFSRGLFSRGLFSRGVLSRLRANQRTVIALSAPEAPAGADTGAAMRVLAPGYHSGIAVRVGTPATVYVEAELQSRDGTPLAWRSGRVEGAGAPSPPADATAAATGNISRKFLHGTPPTASIMAVSRAIMSTGTATA